MQNKTFDNASEIQQHLNCHPVTAKLLFSRGYTNQESLKLLFQPELSKLPDPNCITDMAKSVDRVIDAILKNQKIVIYGDYDVDGTCGSAVLSEFFSQINRPVKVYQPNRFKEGYGINLNAIHSLIDEGSELIISVDCGITAHEPAKLCKSRNVDLIIIDHHKCTPELPEAFSIINPQRADDGSGLKTLCGTSLAFFFIVALRSKLRESGFFKNENIVEPNLKSFLDLVAVATVADVMDVRGINRILLTYGLKVLNENPRIGIKAILEKAKIKKVTAMHCGFILGPRINAAGRLEHAKSALELLTCNDEKIAKQMADDLEEVNLSRRKIQDSVVSEAEAHAEKQIKEFQNEYYNETAALSGPWPRALVLYSEHWHEGVLGIAASKLVEKFKRPVIVLANKENSDQIKGSIRSFAKIDIISQLQTESVLKTIVNCGGHAHAGGVTLEKNKLNEFILALNNHMSQTTSQNDFIKVVNHDAEISIKEITTQLMSEIELLEPFGHQFPEPIFKVSHIVLQDLKVLKEKHLKLKFPYSAIEGMWFNVDDIQPKIEYLQNKKTSHFWVSPQWNEWNGTRKMQISIRNVEFTEF